MKGSPRRWLELGLRCPPAGEAEVLLTEVLVALGGRAVEERGGWFVTHLQEPADMDAFLGGLRALVAAYVGPPGRDLEVRTGWRAHEDWTETWKRGLAPRRVSDRIVVTTTWHPVEPRPGEVVLTIDPGMAFGTAEHGTTRGCLRLLDRAVAAGERVVDVGAGSGILAIAAARLGAGHVLALEGDPLAVEALAENVARNGVAARVTWRTAWADETLLAELAPRDGVVANIESGVLGRLLAGFAAALVPGGWLILSGIPTEEWDGMRGQAEERGFRLQDVDEDGSWRSGRFTRV